jgi:hypothetical protein
VKKAANRNFHFNPDFISRTGTTRFANAKFEPGFEPGGLPTTPQRTSSASRWHKAPETGVFPTKLSDTSPFPPYLVTEICCALRTAYSRWRRQRCDPPQHAAE